MTGKNSDRGRGRMSSYFESVKFIVFSRLGNLAKVTAKEISLHAGREDQQAFIYLPRRGVPRGTILVVHGMAVMANRDPRLIGICRAFAACGYAVVSPLYADIAAFSISRGTVDRIVNSIKAVIRDASLCPSGRVSIFAPSFSAGMTVIAASIEEVSSLVDSLCLVGTYSTIDSSVRYLLEEQDIDDYGRLIILRNFINHAPGFSKDIPEVLHTAILDNGLRRSTPELPGIMAALGEKDRNDIMRLLKEPGFRMEQWKLILARSGEVNSLLRELSVVSKLGGLKAPVAMVHGSGDRVIPPAESVSLNNRLKQHNIASRLLVTPLLSHGDVSMGLDALKEILRLVWLFAFFFRYAAAVRPVRSECPAIPVIS